MNKSDPTGDLSLGICARFETHIVFIQLGAGDCLVEILDGTNKGQIGVTGTGIAGLGVGLNRAGGRSRPLYNRVEFGRIRWTFRKREASPEDWPGHRGRRRHLANVVLY